MNIMDIVTISVIICALRMCLQHTDLCAESSMVSWSCVETLRWQLHSEYFKEIPSFQW